MLASSRAFGRCNHLYTVTTICVFKFFGRYVYTYDRPKKEKDSDDEESSDEDEDEDKGKLQT